MRYCAPPFAALVLVLTANVSPTATQAATLPASSLDGTVLPPDDKATGTFWHVDNPGALTKDGDRSVIRMSGIIDNTAYPLYHFGAAGDLWDEGFSRLHVAFVVQVDQVTAPNVEAQYQGVSLRSVPDNAFYSIYFSYRDEKDPTSAKGIRVGGGISGKGGTFVAWDWSTGYCSYEIIGNINDGTRSARYIARGPAGKDVDITIVSPQESVVYNMLEFGDGIGAQQSTQLYDSIELRYEGEIRLSEEVADSYNTAMVNASYLQEEIEALRRATSYVRGIARSEAAAKAADKAEVALSQARGNMSILGDFYYAIFADKRTNPAARENYSGMKLIQSRLQEVGTHIEAERDAVKRALGFLANDPEIRRRSPGFKEFRPSPPRPLRISPEGKVNRIAVFSFIDDYDRELWHEQQLTYDAHRQFRVTSLWPTPDKFEHMDPKRYDEFRQAGLKVSEFIVPVAIGETMFCPRWLWEKYGSDPDLYLAPELMRKEISFTSWDRVALEYRHPEVRKMILEYVENVTRFLGREDFFLFYLGAWEPHPYMPISFQVPGVNTWACQELGGASKYALRDFQQHLQNEFSTIEKLNAAWRLPTSQSYRSFEEILPPEKSTYVYATAQDSEGNPVESTFYPSPRMKATPLTYEYEKWRKDSYMTYFEDCYRAAKRGDPLRPWACSDSGGIMSGPLDRSIDDLALAERAVDIWGKHPSGSASWWEGPYQWALNRYFGKTLASLEYYGWAYEVTTDKVFYEMGSGKEMSPSLQEKAFHAGRRDFWHDVSWDRRLLNAAWDTKVFQARPGVRNECSPLLKHLGTCIPVEWRRLRQLNDIWLNQLILEPKIAVLYPSVSLINAYPTNGCAKVAVKIFELLSSRQYHFGVLPEDFILIGRDSLDKYDVVILPYVQYFPQGLSSSLLKWVRKGGTLISAGPFGLYDRYGFDLKEEAAEVFPGIRFSYPAPEDEKILSYRWEAERNGKKLNDSLLTQRLGKGLVFVTLNGMAFDAGWKGLPSHQGLELGGAVSAAMHVDPKVPEFMRKQAIPETREAIATFYKALDKATKRQAWVDSGNVELILRGKNQGVLYLSALNRDHEKPCITTVHVRGTYRDVADLCIPNGFPVPVAAQNGMTTWSLHLGPGEGIMFCLRRSHE